MPREPDPIHSLDELLKRVYKKARSMERRRRLTRWTSIAAAVALVASASAFGIRALSSPEVQAAETPSPDATVTETDLPAPSAEPSPSPVPSGEETPGPSAAPTLVCRNSTNPDCGEFYWDPDPGPNAPLTIEIEMDPINPEPGKPVTFTITVDDPDAVVSADGIIVRMDQTAYVHPDCRGLRYGPWDTPAKKHGRAVVTRTYTLSSGYHTISVQALSEGYCGGEPNSPYGSASHTSRSFLVGGTDPPTESPTTSPSPTESATPEPSPSPSPA